MKKQIINYYREVDIVKGITILLVILGHSFCTYPINIDDALPLLARIVRSFQMPLFFVASGFLFSTKGGFESLIKKKISRLIIPYFAFGFLSIVLRYIFSAFTNGGMITLSDSILKLINGNYYWFLYTLLFVMIIAQLLNRKKLLALACCICIGLCLLTDLRSVELMTFGKIIYYFPFFCLGIMTKQIYSPILTFYEQREYIVSICACVGFALSFFQCLGVIGNLIDFYIQPLLGIMLVWIISIRLTKTGRWLSDLFTYFGHFSLQFYLNHLLIMLPLYYMASMLSCFHPLILLFIIFILSVVISILMLKIEQRMKITRFLCALK